MELDNNIIFAFFDTFNLKVQKKKKKRGEGGGHNWNWLDGRVNRSFSQCVHKAKNNVLSLSRSFNSLWLLDFYCGAHQQLPPRIRKSFQQQQGSITSYISLQNKSFFKSWFVCFFSMSRGTTMQKVKNRKKMQNQIILLNKKIINVLSLTFR